MKSYIILTIISCLLASAAVSSQELIKTDTTFSRTINTQDNLHHYQVFLEKDKFINGQVLQKGVDIEVMVVDAQGFIIEVFDSPNGKNGPEQFYFTTSDSGNFKIRIIPLEKGASGDYEFNIQKVLDVPGNPPEQAHQLFRSLVKPEHPGMVVTVIKNGEIVYKEGFGRSNIEEATEITPSTPFHIASISKQFTGYAINLLINEGKLSLNDNIRKYLPDFPEYEGPIKVKDLLYHTSGIKDQWQLHQQNGGILSDTIRQQDLYRLILSQKALNFTPGTDFHYSNSNYLLLAEIIEKITLQSFNVWMEKNVFAPAGLQNTVVKTIVSDNTNPATNSYAFLDDSIVYLPLNYENYGATNISSTAEDLTKWLLHLDSLYHNPLHPLNGFLDKGKFIAQISPTDSLYYGSGINLLTYRGQELISHSGADAGYKAILDYYPSIHSGIIILGNYSSINDSYLSEWLAEIFFKEELQPVNKRTAPEMNE